MNTESSTRLAALFKEWGFGECEAAIVRESADTYKLRIEIPVNPKNGPRDVAYEFVEWLSESHIVQASRRSFEEKTAHLEKDAARYRALRDLFKD